MYQYQTHDSERGQFWVQCRVSVHSYIYYLLTSSVTNADIKYDYTLTEEFCREHFLAGLVLREVGFALHDVTEVRQYGIRVLRNLLAKHSFDDRYTSKVSLINQKTRKNLKKDILKVSYWIFEVLITSGFVMIINFVLSQQIYQSNTSYHIGHTNISLCLYYKQLAYTVSKWYKCLWEKIKNQ